MSEMQQGRIIIDCRDVPLTRAIRCVAEVVSEGYISKSGDIPHFCWVTTFIDGTHVIARRNKPGQNSDSFLVYRNTEVSDEHD